MKISLFLRKTKSQEDASTVCVRVRNEAKDIKAVTPLTANPKYWDAKVQGYKPSTPVLIVSKKQRDYFNAKLASLISYIEEHVDEDVTAQDLKDAIAKFVVSYDSPELFEDIEEEEEEPLDGPLTLHDAYSKYLKSAEFSKAHTRYCINIQGKLKRMVTWRRVMENMDDPELYVDDIDNQTLSEIRDYVANEHIYYKQYPNYFEQFGMRKCYVMKICPNTLAQITSRIMGLLTWCNKRGYTTNQKYKGFDHGTLVNGSPYFLTLEERDIIYNADLSAWPQSLQDSRDKFMFQCMVGCRLGDIQRFTWDNIVDGFLEYVPMKTKKILGTNVRVPLNSKALAILERQPKSEDGLLFPRHSRQTYNSDIHMILQLLGINRMVTVLNRHTKVEEQHPIYELATSHMGRRTFIGNLYAKVKDQELISQLTGHAPGSKAFARYRTIDDTIKEETIKKID